MRIDGLEISEGASLTNLVAPKGGSFPGSPDAGELFFRTPAEELFVHRNGTWEKVQTRSADGTVSLDSAVADALMPARPGLSQIGGPNAHFGELWVEDMHVGPNTLYIGSTPVLGTESSNVIVKADADQSITVRTTGLGASAVTSESKVEISTSGMNADVLVQAKGQGAKVRVSSPSEVVFEAPNLTMRGSAGVDGPLSCKDLTVTGNLNVSSGQVTSISTTSLVVSDNIIEVNKDQTGSGVTAGTAGLKVNRGDASPFLFVFDEADDMFKVGTVGFLETVASQNWVNGRLATKLDATATAASASKLASPMTIALGGDLSGSASTDGTGTVTINASVGDGTHAHDAQYLSLATGGTVGGVIRAPGFYVESRAELKENVTPFGEAFPESAVEILDGVDVVAYNYIADEGKELKIGFIADVTDPRLSGSARDRFDTGNVAGILIRAVQELRAELLEARARIGELEARLG